VSRFGQARWVTAVCPAWAGSSPAPRLRCLARAPSARRRSAARRMQAETRHAVDLHVQLPSLPAVERDVPQFAALPGAEVAGSMKASEMVTRTARLSRVQL
jgi:hypothetical protein